MAATTAVLAGGLAACGTVQQLTAADKVSKAFGKLGDGKTFKFELSVDATADQLIGFGTATQSPIKRPAAEALAGLNLSLAVSADKPLKEYDAKQSDGKGLNFEYLISDKKGKVYADLRLVDAKTYVKIDAAAIAKLTGEDPSIVGSMADELPAGMKVFKDALAGKWLTFDPKLFQELSKNQQAKRPGAPSAAPSLDPKVTEELGKSIKDVLSRDLTFDDKGTKDGVDHILATAPARGLVNDLLKVVKPLAKNLPNRGTPFPSEAPTTVPDTKVGVDLYLKNDALSSLTFDVAQLDEKAGPGAHLPIKITFSQDVAAPTAPTGATEIKMSDITEMMGIFAKDTTKGLGTTPKGLGGTPSAAPMTDAQIKELAQLSGMSESQIKMMNASGLGYQEMKDMLSLKS